MKAPTWLSLIAPFVFFGFLYVLLVQPQRNAADATQHALASLRQDPARQALFGRRPPVVDPSGTTQRFDIRTARTDPAQEFVQTLTGILGSPAVGGVEHLSISTASAGPVPRDSPVATLQGTFAGTPVVVTFEAAFEQVGRFFSNLRAMPTTYEVRSVELTRASSAVTRVRAVFLAFQHDAGKPLLQADTATTQPKRRPSVPPARANTLEPSVTSILVAAGGRRVALVDGRIVRVGDRLGADIVTAIEPDTVVLTGADRRERRVSLVRPIRHMAQPKG